MLSGETAIGAHPVRSVETMRRIILDAEANAHEWGEPPKPARPDLRDDAVATTRAARKLAEDRQVAALAVFTRSGRTARLMSKARPTAQIVGFTPEPATYTQMTLLWGVRPKQCPLVRTVEEMMEIVESELLGANWVEPGQQVVIVASLPLGERGPPNSIYLRTVS
jgi:pyruvate kinase